MATHIRLVGQYIPQLAGDVHSTRTLRVDFHYGSTRHLYIQLSLLNEAS